MQIREALQQIDAELSHKPRINHILHLLLTLVTGGAWGIIWFILVMVGTDDMRSLHLIKTKKELEKFADKYGRGYSVPPRYLKEI